MFKTFELKFSTFELVFGTFEYKFKTFEHRLALGLVTTTSMFNNNYIKQRRK